MTTVPGSTEASSTISINRRRLTLSMFSSKEKEKDRLTHFENDVEAVKTEKPTRKKSQVPSGGRGGLGNIRANRSCAPPSSCIDPELAKLLNPANFSLSEPNDGVAERANSCLHQISSSSVLTQASPGSQVGSTSSGLSNDRPPLLSINTSLRSSSGSGSSVFSVFRRSAASQSSSSFATTCPSSFSHLRPCEQSIIEAAIGRCSSEHGANSIASRPQRGVEHSPSSPVAATSGTSVSSPSLHRMPSSLSHASSGTSSSNSSGSIGINTELLQRLNGGAVSVDASTAAAYVAHLRLDTRARRALHHSNVNRLGRVDEEQDIDSEKREGKPGRKGKRKGKKHRNGDSSPNQYIVRVRTGRGGAGIAYQKDGIDAVDPETHPMAAALTRNNAVRTALQEQEILEASRARAKMVIRTGRGGAGSINMTKAKAMAKHAKKSEASKETGHKKRKGGFGSWLRTGKLGATRSPLSDVEEHIEVLAIDGNDCQDSEDNIDSDEANNMAGIGAHKVSSAIQPPVASSSSSYRQRNPSTEGDSLYNRSVRVYGTGQTAFDDVIMSLPDGIDIDGISLIFDDDEEEQEDDSDLDPELSPTAEHFHFKDYIHRCERVDAGGGIVDFSAYPPKQDIEDEYHRASLETLYTPSEVHFGRDVEHEDEIHRAPLRLGARCAPSRAPPPTSALPPIPGAF